MMRTLLVIFMLKMGPIEHGEVEKEKEKELIINKAIGADDFILIDFDSSTTGFLEKEIDYHYFIIMVAIINKVNKVSSRTKIITLLKTCVWIEIRGSEIIFLQYPFHSNIRTSYRFLPLVACCALISHIVPYLSFPMLYRILRPHLRKIIKYVPAL
jgi:hypothetical protein